jgi:hypothetical protein
MARRRDTNDKGVPIIVGLPESFVPCPECGLHYVIRNQKPKPWVCKQYAERDALPERV